MLAEEKLQMFIKKNQTYKHQIKWNHHLSSNKIVCGVPWITPSSTHFVYTVLSTVPRQRPSYWWVCWLSSAPSGVCSCDSSCCFLSCLCVIQPYHLNRIIIYILNYLLPSSAVLAFVLYDYMIFAWNRKSVSTAKFQLSRKKISCTDWVSRVYRRELFLSTDTANTAFNYGYKLISGWN